MIKEEKSTQEITIHHKYCDDCGVEIKRGMACSAAKCEMCGKDLCDKCVEHEDNGSGDYRIVYCSRCWRIGLEYFEKIKIYVDEIENLNTEWLRKCLDKQV